jgi:serine protease
VKSGPRLITCLAIVAVVALLAVGLLPGSGPAPLEAQGEIAVKKGGPPAATDEVVPTELIVKFKPGTSRADRAAAVQDKAAILKRELLLRDFVLVRVPEGKEQEFRTRLEAHPRVELVEPNAIARIDFSPNDTYYSYQWHMPQIQMEQAWEVASGSRAVVAILDTGVAYEDYGGFAQAPDLACTSFKAPKDFINNDYHANDDNGHGTHVAGTVTQCTNNSLGVAGVAFDAAVMPVKVLDSSGSGSHANIADGIVWATNNRADVINMSLGGPHSSTLETAVNYALSNGVVVVAAAGNGGADTIGDPVLDCPACYPGVIAVGATDYNMDRAYYSNYGTGRGGHTLDLVAPGGDITADLNGDTYVDGVLQETFEDTCDGIEPPVDLTSFVYCFLQGTSMATPHVAGAAAVLLSADPGITRQQVANCLTSTATDRGAAGYDLEYGYGLIQVRDALGCVEKEAFGAVSWGKGRLDVFARASDNALWHRWFMRGQGWSGWEELGGTLNSGPAVSSWTEGRLDVFALGTDDKLRHKWYIRGKGWLPGGLWENLGAPSGLTLTSDIGAVSWGDRRIDVFARASDNALWHKYYARGRGWSGWEYLGGVLNSGPAVSSWAVGRLDVFALGTDDKLRHKWYVRGQGWLPKGLWENLGAPSGLTLASDPGVVSWDDGRIDVFARASDNALWHRWYVRGQGWSGWEKFAGTFNSSPAVSSWVEGRLDVFALGTDYNLRHKWYARGQGWQPKGTWEKP